MIEAYSNSYGSQIKSMYILFLQLNNESSYFLFPPLFLHFSLSNELGCRSPNVMLYPLKFGSYFLFPPLFLHFSLSNELGCLNSNTMLYPLKFGSYFLSPPLFLHFSLSNEMGCLSPNAMLYPLKFGSSRNTYGLCCFLYICSPNNLSSL